MLIDTHAHLYWDSYKADLDQVIQRALDSGVNTVINVGVDVEKSKEALKQIQGELSKFAGLSSYSTIGIHPHEALRYTHGKLSDIDVSIHEDIEKLEQIYQTSSGKIVAVGECGLDFLFRSPVIPSASEESLDSFQNKSGDSSPSAQNDNQIKDLQISLFQAQIDLAKKLNLPLIVHCRDDRGSTSSPPPKTSSSSAWDLVLKMVGNHPTILHCYSGLEQATRRVLEKTSILVSFAATITYPKNEYLREAVKILPLERIVLETDCPFLPPQSKRGQRNEPASVLEIAQLITALKGISLEEVAKKTTENVNTIFNIDPSTRSARSG